MQGSQVDLMTKEVTSYDQELYKTCDKIIVSKIKDTLVKDHKWMTFSPKILTKQGASANHDKEAWMCKFYEYFMMLNQKISDLHHILLNQEL
jgi:hypothetical protein